MKNKLQGSFLIALLLTTGCSLKNQAKQSNSDFPDPSESLKRLEDVNAQIEKLQEKANPLIIEQHKILVDFEAKNPGYTIRFTPQGMGVAVPIQPPKPPNAPDKAPAPTTPPTK